MNCRQIQRILPELVSGEIDEKTAVLAHAHMASCPACASEYAGYQAALCALAQPRKSVECPPALDVLLLPEPRRGWSWARPVFVTAALAAVLAGIMFAPRSQEMTTKPYIASNPPQSQTATNPSESREVVPPVKTATVKPAVADSRRTRTESPRPRVKHTVVALADTGNPGGPEVPAIMDLKYAKEDLDREPLVMKSAVLASAPSPSASAEAWAFDSARSMDDKPEGSVIVLACDLDTDASVGAAAAESAEPVIMRIESTDESTGSTVLYDYSVDSEGREQIIETTSSRPLGS